MKKKQKSRLPKFMAEIGKEVEEAGWRVMVLGGARVEQRVGAPKFHYELVIPFTGAKRDETPHPERLRRKGKGEGE